MFPVQLQYPARRPPMTELICIVCPKGCSLRVDENNDFKVTGHECARGEIYGRDELKNPTRVITSTVKIDGAIYRRCPVKTKSAIPKHLIRDAMLLLENVELTSPVEEGHVVIEDVLGAGIRFITTRSL
jgi:CxxC motif-containing protein